AAAPESAMTAAGAASTDGNAGGGPAAPGASPHGGAARARPAPFFSALARPPLDPPLTINGGFGEYRPGHFHAGVDLGTGERVGKPVHAPLAGWIARVRTSGVGYGRSLYLQALEGRLLQFGHLDAFAEPIASAVAAVQDSSGQYEQDLWLEPRRYPVSAGDVMAWTGESGAGGPHLHFEVRRGDTAYNPFRAGLVVRDATAPTIESLTLEPLDEASFVERCASPYTLRFGARRDTLRVEGRVRAVVSAFDGAGPGARRIVPWSLAVEFGGRTIECRFDSLSWATDMSECEYVFDAGRIVGGRGLVPGEDGAAAFVASTRGAEWAVVIPAAAWQSPWHVRGRDASGLEWSEQGPPLDFGDDASYAARDAQSGRGARGFRWSLPRDARFEPDAIAENLRPAP